MTASDFRSLARQILSGKWKIAILAGLIANLFFPLIEFTPSTHTSYDCFRILFFSIPLKHWLFRFPPVAFMSAFIVGIVGSVLSVGYAGFNLELVDQRQPQLYTLLDPIACIPTVFCAQLIKAVLVLLGTMFFVVPGILILYNYSMTSYVQAEHPNLSAREALARSKELMRGNRWRLFCLHFSFLGWHILSALTLDIGKIFLVPYCAAAEATFYRELTGGPLPHRTSIMDF